jgi:chromosome segregation ATPase
MSDAMTKCSLSNPCHGLTGVSLLNQGARCVLVAGLLAAACASPADPARVEAQARAFKATAADATNVLFYMAGSLKVQTHEMETLQRASSLMKSQPQARDLQGFMSLAPQLVAWSETLQLTRLARTEVESALAKAQPRIAEIDASIADLETGLSRDVGKLGSSAQQLTRVHGQLKATAATLGTFAAATATYLKGAASLETSAGAMLRELDLLSRAQAPQDGASTLARLSSFSDEVVADTKQLEEALRDEATSRDAGLASLLECFEGLASLPDLPPVLSQEIREAIKLIDDVRKGASFSPIPG